MIKGLKCSIIVLVSLMAFERLISAENEDDLAWEKINKLLLRYPRSANENQMPNDFNKKELESKLSNLLEFRRRDSPFVRYDPADEQDQENTADDTEEVDSVGTTTEKTTGKPSTKPKRKHKPLIEKIRQKLPDKNTKLTISLPVAMIIFGSTVIVTCCCALYVRNRLVACVHKLFGKKKHKRANRKRNVSKTLFADTERGRSIPRSRKKSISSRRARARSLSQDVRNITVEKSNTIITTNENDEPSTTGCYRCCKKKKKRANRNKK